MTTLHPKVCASLDPSLHAVLEDIVPLVYADGASREHDLPAYVRAASSIRRLGRHLVIVQDDVNAFAIRDDEGEVFPLMLPRGPGGRRMFDDVIGNKSQKMDLEACALLPDERLVAFGSGASAARQHLVVVSRELPPRLLDGAELYRALREQRAFSGSELNIEGAVVWGERLVVFQRGNGARGAAGARPGAPPAARSAAAAGAVNAVGVLDLETFMRWLDGAGPVPELLSITPFDLGDRDGAVFGFTDAAVMDDGRIAVLACAEDSSSALTDGPILGCRFGYLEPGRALRMTDVMESGAPSRLKLEGIESRTDGAHEFESRTESAHEFDVVADVDKPSEPSVLARLRVE